MARVFHESTRFDLSGKYSNAATKEELEDKRRAQVGIFAESTNVLKGILFITVASISCHL